MINLTEVSKSKMNYTIDEGKVISMLAIKDFVPGSAIGAVTVGIQSIYSIITCPEQFKTNGQWDVTKLNRLMPALGKESKKGHKYDPSVLKDFKVEKKDKYGRKNSINRINSKLMLVFLQEIKLVDVAAMTDTDMFFLVKDFDQIGQAFAEAAVDVQKDKSKTFSFDLNSFVSQKDITLEYRCFKSETVAIGKQKDNSFKIKKDYSPEKIIKDYMGLVGNTIANVSEKVLNEKIKPLLDAADKLAFKEATAKAAANRKDIEGRKILESLFIAMKAYEKAVAELDKPSKVKMARLYRELIYSIVKTDVIIWTLAACHCFVGDNGNIAIGRNMANINLVMEILPKEFIYHLCGEEALKLHVSYSNIELLEGAEFFVNNGECFDYDEDGRPVKIFLKEDYTGPVIVKASGIFPMYPEDVLIGDLNSSREVIIIKNHIMYDKYTGERTKNFFEYNVEALQEKVIKGRIGFNKEANEIVSRDSQGVETVLGQKLLIKKGAGTNVTCRMIDYCEFGAVLFIKTE